MRNNGGSKKCSCETRKTETFELSVRKLIKTIVL